MGRISLHPQGCSLMHFLFHSLKECSPEAKPTALLSLYFRSEEKKKKEVTTVFPPVVT